MEKCSCLNEGEGEGEGGGGRDGGAVVMQSTVLVDVCLGGKEWHAVTQVLRARTTGICQELFCFKFFCFFLNMTCS